MDGQPTLPSNTLFIFCSLQVNGDHEETEATWDKSDTEALEDATISIIDDEGFSLEEFIVYVREKTRNGLFDEYHGIKTNPPEGTFDHARMMENLVKVRLTKNRFSYN